MSGDAEKIVRMLFATCALASSAWAQDYPSHPIRLISPNPAGGANDTIARIVVNKLTEVLGVQVVIDNRGGGGGVIGGEIAAHATPDGYTLLAGSVSTHSFAPLIHPKLGYDPVRDFAPISLFAIAQNLLVVNPSVPAANVRELIALAKARPGTLNYASGGTGSTSHFAVAFFVSAADIIKQTVHVPYKGGAPAITATIANETQFYFGPMAGGTIPHVKAGRLRALAVGGEKRSPALPDVPTVAESGLPGYKNAGWFGLFAPAHTPPAIIARLNQAVVKTMSAPDVAQRFVELAVDPVSGTPDELRRFVVAQLEFHRAMVAKLGLKFD
ncbi:MAG: tripartite tricarboxylate transporter substrate binding protein [Betaproteobacteria bacterium]